MREDAKTYGEWLTKEMKAQSVSNAELKSAIARPKAPVTEWKKGNAMPGRFTRGAIASFLGVQFADTPQHQWAGIKPGERNE